MGERRFLTPRQQQVMDLILDGLSYGEIARRLQIENQTVRLHVSHIKRAFGLHGPVHRLRAYAELVARDSAA